jgi:hypothetical protein
MIAYRYRPVTCGLITRTIKEIPTKEIMKESKRH